MKRLSLMALALTALLATGCGGMPEPMINEVAPVGDATNVRVAMIASNYSDAWDKENVRLRCFQIWLNDAGVPVTQEEILDKPYNGRQGDSRAVIKMQDAAGEESYWVRLKFELVSGENRATETITAAKTREWKLSSTFAKRDIVLVAYISRKARNDYQIDVLYAKDPKTGEVEQLLPSYDAR